VWWVLVFKALINREFIIWHAWCMLPADGEFFASRMEI
jgi:hypothetical protein